jgi:hypothetical protein
MQKFSFKDIKIYKKKEIIDEFHLGTDFKKKNNRNERKK